jgi:hypothetical protein
MRFNQLQTESASHSPSSKMAKYKASLLISAVAIGALLGRGSPPAADAAHGRLPRSTQAAHLQQVAVRTTAPGDVYMQALLTQNMQLAWKQLCPAVQQEMPASDLANPIDALRANAANKNVRLDVMFVGARPWNAGGEIRIYAITAQGASGTDIRALYVLHTETNGCVDSALT